MWTREPPIRQVFLSAVRGWSDGPERFLEARLHDVALLEELHGRVLAEDVLDVRHEPDLRAAGGQITKMSENNSNYVTFL